MKAQTIQVKQQVAQALNQNRRRTDNESINWDSVCALAFLASFWIAVIQVF